MVSASFLVTTPTMRPCSSTRRTLGTAISSLTRGPSRVGVRFIGGLAIYVLLKNFDMARREAAARRFPARIPRPHPVGGADSAVNLAMASWIGVWWGGNVPVDYRQFTHE